MKSSWITTLVCACMAGLTGCGGSGGSSSGGGGGGATNSSTLNASMTLIGGFLDSTATAGTTTNVQLTDANGKVHTISGIYTPDTLSSDTNITNPDCTIVRAGSSLLSGHYTSTTAKYINPGENFSSTVPLTSSGTFAKDTIIPYGCEVVLPIDKIGGYTFPNGITVTFNSGINDYSVQNNTLSFSAAIPSSGKSTPNAGQMTFTDSGTVSPQGAMHLSFSSADQLSGVIVQTPSSTNSLSPVSLQAETVGSSTVMSSASVYYDLED